MDIYLLNCARRCDVAQSLHSNSISLSLASGITFKHHASKPDRYRPSALPLPHGAGLPSSRVHMSLLPSSDASNVHTVIQSLSSLVSRKKDPREVVQQLRHLSVHPLPPPSFLRGTVLPALVWLRASKSGGEDNKAIRSFYQMVSALAAEGVVDDRDANAIFTQLRTGDLRDPFTPRQLAALRTYADVAARFPAAKGGCIDGQMGIRGKAQ